MSEQADRQQQTVADALAQRVEARQGTRSGWAEALRELGAIDRAVYQAVARTPTPALDRPFRGLSNVANYSRLWLGIAVTVALTGGKRGNTTHVDVQHVHSLRRPMISRWLLAARQVLT
jgi:hypothetical protein